MSRHAYLCLAVSYSHPQCLEVLCALALSSVLTSPSSCNSFLNYIIYHNDDMYVSCEYWMHSSNTILLYCIKFITYGCIQRVTAEPNRPYLLKVVE